MGKKTERKNADPAKLLPKVAKAILDGASVRSAGISEGLSHANASSLAKAIATPIEQFNERLASELGRVANVYLQKIEDAADSMPDASLAYTFAVLVDKRTALTGRTNPAGVSVALQINNNGVQMSKDELMDLLHGKKRMGADNTSTVAVDTTPAPETP